MINLLKSIDMFGVPFSIKSNDKKDSFQTIFGAFITILLIFASFSIGMYFFLIFIRRQDSVIVSSTKSSDDVFIKDYHKFPFLMKISLSGNLVIPNEEQVWRIQPYMYVLDPAISGQFKLTLLPYSRCSASMFPGYEDIVNTLPDLNAYFCLNYGDKQFDLKGKYGDSQYQNFLNIRIRGCYTSNGDGPCQDPAVVNKYTSALFLDVKSLNTIIDHKAINPVQYELVGDRIPLYNSMTKRLYYYYKNVNYITDWGFIFEETSSIHLNQFPLYIADTGLAAYTDPKDKNYYGTFAIIYVTNSKSMDFYTRTYMKAQQLLANIGGIINGLMISCKILTFLIVNRLTDLYLANIMNMKLYKIFHEERKDEIREKKKEIMGVNLMNQNSAIKTNTNINETKKESNFNISDLKRDKVSPFKIQSSVQETNLPKETLKIHDLFRTDSNVYINSKISLRLHEIFLPICCYCNKEKKVRLTKQIDWAYELLSITNVNSSLQQIEGIKRCIFTPKEIKLFESNFNTQDEFGGKRINTQNLQNIQNEYSSVIVRSFLERISKN